MARDTEHFRARRALMLTLAVVTTLGVVATVSSAVAETLVVHGSTTFNRRIMEPFRAKIEAAAGCELTILPNKSAPGLIGLMEGRADMAMISAPLRVEIDVLRKAMPGLAYERLREFKVSTTQIAIGIHPSNPVRTASLETVQKILLGELKNWNELSGHDQAIRIALVVGGGITAIVESALLNGRSVSAANVVYVKTPVQLVQVIEQERGAIGFAQLTLVEERGLPKLVTDKSIEQTLSLVTNGDPTPGMQAVIDATRLIARKMM